jgi:hypothetical protein
MNVFNPIETVNPTEALVASANLAWWTWGRFQTEDARRRQYRRLVGLGADILLLQECRPEELLRFAADEGDSLGWTVVGEVPSRWTFCSAILARPGFDLRPVERTDPWLEYLSGYVALGTLALYDTEVVVASVHTVARRLDDPRVTPADHETLRRTGLTEAWHNDLAAAALHQVVDGRSFMFGGDWNIAREFDRHYAPPSCGEFFERCTARGWHESLRKFHPEEVRTFLRPGTRAYELDHIWTDAALHGRLVSCGVFSGTHDVSDHAWLLAHFGG